MLVQSSWCHADGRSQTGHLQHFEFTTLGSGGVASLFGGAAWVLPAGGPLLKRGSRKNWNSPVLLASRIVPKGGPRKYWNSPMLLVSRVVL